MKPFQINRPIMALTLCGSLLGGSPMAHATSLMLSLDDLDAVGIETIVVDNMPIGTPTPKGLSNAADSHPDVGLIMFIGSVGSFSANVATGTSKPIISAPTLLDLNGVHVSSAPGTLEITLTDTDYLLNSQPGHTSFITAIGGITDGLLEAQEWIDLNNQPFGMGLSPGLLGTFGPGVFSATEGLGLELGTGPFSLTKQVRITHTGRNQITSFNLAAQVPEPTTLALMVIGLAGLGFAGRRLRGQSEFPA